MLLKGLYDFVFNWKILHITFLQNMYYFFSTSGNNLGDCLHWQCLLPMYFKPNFLGLDSSSGKDNLYKAWGKTKMYPKHNNFSVVLMAIPHLSISFWGCDPHGNKRIEEGIADSLAYTWKHSGSPQLGVPVLRGMLLQGSASAAATNTFLRRLSCFTPKPSQHQENP